MSDFMQHGLITTLHDLYAIKRERLESLLDQATGHYKIGLVLPVTAADMRAEPFSRITEQLQGAVSGDRRSLRRNRIYRAASDFDPFGRKNWTFFAALPFFCQTSRGCRRQWIGALQPVP